MDTKKSMEHPKILQIELFFIYYLSLYCYILYALYMYVDIIDSDLNRIALIAVCIRKAN